MTKFSIDTFNSKSLQFADREKLLARIEKQQQTIKQLENRIDKANIHVSILIDALSGEGFGNKDLIQWKNKNNELKTFQFELGRILYGEDT